MRRILIRLGIIYSPAAKAGHEAAFARLVDPREDPLRDRVDA